MQMLCCAIFFMVYKDDHNMLRLQPQNLKRRRELLSPHLVAVA